MKLRTIEDISVWVASQRPDIFLLSDTYVNSKAKLLWKCAICAYTFSMNWNGISQGRACPQCGGKVKPSIGKITDFITKHHPGSKCVSTEYIDSKHYMSFLCANNHLFEMKWNDVQQHYWCSHCSRKRTETICMELMSDIFNVSFTPNVHFFYDLDNPKKYYELDGYCSDTKLAFEYNGRQHYEYPNHCHKNEADFISLQQRDKAKVQWCIDNGITLITIPCEYSCRDISKLKLFLEQQKETYVGKENR